MTKNQIAYWEYKENVRHNQQAENEAYRHNTETESVAREQNRINDINAKANVLSAQAAFLNAKNKEQEVIDYGRDISNKEKQTQLDAERLAYEQSQSASQTAVNWSKFAMGAGQLILTGLALFGG